MKKTKFLKIMFFVAPVFLLGACDAVIAGGGFAAMKYFEDPNINLAEKNYAAADYLISRAKGFVKLENSIKTEALQNVDEPALSTDIGRTIARQTGERLIQLGYKVDMTGVSETVETTYPGAETLKIEKPQYVLAGNYFRAKKGIDVRLRMVQSGTGRIVGAFDYNLPYTSEIRTQSKPVPQIFKVSP